MRASAVEIDNRDGASSSSRSLPTIGVAITHRRTRSAQPEEGVEITEPEGDGEAVEDEGSHRPRPGAGGADGDHVGVPREEHGALEEKGRRSSGDTRGD